MEPKLYECKICKKIIAVIKDPGTPTYCCGEEMEELIPGTEDGDIEKHVPVIKTTDSLATVDIGTKEHPSSMEHPTKRGKHNRIPTNTNKTLILLQILFITFCILNKFNYFIQSLPFPLLDSKFLRRITNGNKYSRFLCI